MANTYTSILKYGTQAAYVALETKDANVLYFTDKGKIYKGTQDFTESIVVVTTAPAAPVSGKIYYVTETGTLQAWVNSASDFAITDFIYCRDFYYEIKVEFRNEAQQNH